MTDSAFQINFTIFFCVFSPDIKSEEKHKLNILSVLRWALSNKQKPTLTTWLDPILNDVTVCSPDRALARSPKKAQRAGDPHDDKLSEAHSENTH